MVRPLASLALLLLAGPLAAQAGTPRRLTLEDLTRFRAVSDPQLSPDGAWVAYTVGTQDLKRDQAVSDVWMTSWDGRTTLRLTTTPHASEHTPRWSPDGRYLAFLSDRDHPAETDQVWLLSRRGGEAERITDVRSGVSDYVWSPDGTRLVLVIEDSDSVEVTDALNDADGRDPEFWLPPPPPADTVPAETEPPIVIDRYYFKEDYAGYLRRKRKHLYLFDVGSRRLEQLTYGPHDDLLPTWSPDSRYLVFTSKRRGEDPDRHGNWDLFVMPAERGAVPLPVTRFTGPDAHPDWESRPAWSPDGRFLAYLQGGPDSLIYYALPQLGVIPWGGGTPSLPLARLDRQMWDPQWSPDGRAIYFRLEEDRVWHLARIPAAGGAPETVLGGRRVVAGYSLGGEGRIAVLVDAPDRPAEVFALENGALRPLSRQNDSLLAQLELAPVEEITVRSKDGTTVHGFLVRPLGGGSGGQPAVLNIHGGPVAQFENSFSFWWQLLAADGYAVVAMNPRGSSGRGSKYAQAIWADWGNKDAQDVLAGMDWAVRQGVADPDRLGVGGWSYGGMLTNYVIAQDTRFRAATSGSGISNILAGYGTDMYVREYEAELGAPWKNTATWLKVSFPFLHADRIKTPTLFLCGEKDLNVPLLNSEQMYQALRSLGVPTRLVVYPGEYHGISRPSYQRHRYAQYLGWFGQYLKGPK